MQYALIAKCSCGRKHLSLPQLMEAVMYSCRQPAKHTLQYPAAS